MDIHLLTYLPLWFTSMISLTIGLVVGSFVNVIIYRVPRQMSIVRPPSHCPNCAEPVRARDNIPLISYILLNGRCRSCRTRLSLRYPLVELLLGGLFCFLWQKEGLSPALPFDWAFVSAMVALAGIDLQHRLLPDMITYPAFVLVVGLRGFVTHTPPWAWISASGLEGAFLAAGMVAAAGPLLLAVEWLDFHFVGQHLDEEEDLAPGVADGASSYGKYLNLMTVVLGLCLAAIILVDILVNRTNPDLVTMTETRVTSISGALLSAVTCAGLLWALRLGYFALKRIEGAGFGDVKMLLMVGAYLGMPLSLVMFLLASVVGSVVGLITVVWRRNRYVQLPYGVFIALAAIISLLWGTPMARWYGEMLTP